MLEGKPLKETPAWRALQAHYEKIKNTHLRQLFADDPKRGEHLTAEGAGLYRGLLRRTASPMKPFVHSCNLPPSEASRTGATRCSVATKSM